MKGAEVAYVIHVDTHTHTHPLLDCLFGYRKRARACVHKREVAQALNLGVCHHSVCVCYCLTYLSFFPSLNNQAQAHNHLLLLVRN